MHWLIKSFGLIKLFGLLLRPVAMKFDKALEQPVKAQRLVQQELVEQLVETEYGQFYGVKTIDNWGQLPIVTYDDLANWLETTDNVFDFQKLVSELILFYEKTSGSRGASKQIPYTKSLRRSFSQMFCVWAYDLIQQIPFATGKVYFCVSPKLQKEGDHHLSHPSQSLQTDADYLDSWLAKILSPFLVTLPDAHLPQPPDEFKLKLALRLLQEPNLEIISIWNPSFLTILLDYIAANRSHLIPHIQNPDRRKLLNQTPIPWGEIWPQLRLISCWASANAADTANQLRKIFPDVLVQGKGLLATEAPMTVPLTQAKGCVPILTEVFFEFLSESGDVRLLHELKLGETYTIVISQKGGLYRYRMGDRVKVTHFYKATPCLEFVGREGGISDLVGEKLNPDFVQGVFQKLALSKTVFKTLVPLKNESRYVLLADYLEKDIDAITCELDQLLQSSYHYAQARSLGQLQVPTVICREDMHDRWIRFRTQSGARWGDIKNEVLWPQPVDSDAMERYFSSSSSPTT